jgi:hypothetical protein
MEEIQPSQANESQTIINYPQETQWVRDVLTGEEIGIYKFPWEDADINSESSFYVFPDLPKCQMDDAEIVYFLENAEERFLVSQDYLKSPISPCEVAEFLQKPGFKVVNNQHESSKYTTISAVVFLSDDTSPANKRTRHEIELHASKEIDNYRNSDFNKKNIQ